MSNDEFSEDKELYSDLEEESEVFQPEEQEAVLGAVPEIADKIELKADPAELEADSEDLEDEEDDEGVESFEGQEDFDYEQDPIENAYDLEKGSSLRGQRKRDFRDGLPSSTRVESIKEFFNSEVIYRFDILNDKEREDLKGTYRFDLSRGGKVSDSWTLLVEEELTAENVKKDADLVVEVGELDFLNLVNGKINPQLAVLANKILFTGDPGALFRINAIIYPGD